MSVQLDNGISAVAGENDMLYRAVITTPKGEQKWLSAPNMNELARRAFAYGMETGPSLATPTFQSYSDSVLTRFKANTIKQTTMIGYRGYCKNYLYPYFGNIMIDCINPAMIQSYLNNVKYLAKKTLHEHLQYMIQVFDYAIAEHYITENPARNKIITIPSRRITTRDTLAEDNIRDIYEHLPDLRPEDASIVAFYLFTGMRRGELAGLQRKFIGQDFIDIKKEAVYPGGNEPYLDYTGKTASALRLVPIIDILRPFISDCDPEYYIYRKEKDPPTLAMHRRTWDRIKNTIDMHGATPHILRHTFITVCNNACIDLKTTKLIVGHSSQDITLGRYTHGMKSMLTRAATEINNEFLAIINPSELKQDNVLRA